MRELLRPYTEAFVGLLPWLAIGASLGCILALAAIRLLV